jgi:hypothetical protein
MTKKLSEQIQAALDVLEAAERETARATLALRRANVYLGLEYNHVEEDIARIVNKVRYMKHLTQRRELEAPRVASTPVRLAVPLLGEGMLAQEGRRQDHETARQTDGASLQD